MAVESRRGCYAPPLPPALPIAAERVDSLRCCDWPRRRQRKPRPAPNLARRARFRALLSLSLLRPRFPPPRGDPETFRSKRPPRPGPAPTGDGALGVTGRAGAGEGGCFPSRAESHYTPIPPACSHKLGLQAAPPAVAAADTVCPSVCPERSSLRDGGFLPQAAPTETRSRGLPCPRRPGGSAGALQGGRILVLRPAPARPAAATARRSPEPAALHNSGVYSHSALGQPHTQFLRLEQRILLSGAKFLLLDRQGELRLEVYDGPLHHHQAVLVQQVGEEEGLRGRQGAGAESAAPAPLCSCPAAGSGLAITRGVAEGGKRSPGHRSGDRDGDQAPGSDSRDTVTHLELLADLEGVELPLPSRLGKLLQGALVHQEGTAVRQGLRAECGAHVTAARATASSVPPEPGRGPWPQTPRHTGSPGTCRGRRTCRCRGAGCARGSGG